MQALQNLKTYLPPFRESTKNTFSENSKSQSVSRFTAKKVHLKNFDCYFIGSDETGESGLGYAEALNQQKNITKILRSNRNIFHGVNKFYNVWVAGSNRYGQLGINTDD